MNKVYVTTEVIELTDDDPVGAALGKIIRGAELRQMSLDLSNALAQPNSDLELVVLEDFPVGLVCQRHGCDVSVQLVEMVFKPSRESVLLTTVKHAPPPDSSYKHNMHNIHVVHENIPEQAFRPAAIQRARERWAKGEAERQKYKADLLDKAAKRAAIKQN
jgi:hypothetical protein